MSETTDKPDCVCGCPAEHSAHCEHGCTIYEPDWQTYTGSAPVYWSGAGGMHWEPGCRTFPPIPPDRAQALMNAYDHAGGVQ